jgi:arginine-tRNA-protein transferase
LTVLTPHPCAYLPGRTTTLRAFACGGLDGGIYHDFMDRGFRRSGRMIYQPVCDRCRACVPIRVPVATFQPDKSQRRCQRRNADLRISVGSPMVTDEKFLLYRRYLDQWHDRPGDVSDEDERASFESFLYDSPVDTLEFCYRDGGGALLAVGIADVCPRSFSSVYFYFDPAHRDRGLGTFGALHEISWAASAGIPHYYLGYWIGDCRKMAYKRNFRPYELLSADGRWDPSTVEATPHLG